MSEECMELQNIKYQTMLLNGNSKVTSNKVPTEGFNSCCPVGKGRLRLDISVIS